MIARAARSDFTMLLYEFYSFVKKCYSEIQRQFGSVLICLTSNTPLQCNMKCSSRRSGQENNDTSVGLNQDRLKSVGDKDKDKGSDKGTSLPPVARSSWGAIPVDPKGDEKDADSDHSEDEMAESVSEVDQSLEESGSHEGPIPSQPKRNNQEEDDDQVLIS